MNILIKSVILAFLVVSCAFAGDIKPFEGARPVAVMIESDPWLMVMGSDTPSFVLYEDGKVVYLKISKGNPPKYMSASLPKEVLTAFKSRLAALMGSGKVQGNFDVAGGITDQPETKIYLDINGKQAVTSIYGLTRELPETRGLPAELGSLYSLLCRQKFPAEREWAPQYLEVMVSPFEYAKKPPILWPRDWPDLNSSSSFRRQDSYSIFVPWESRKRLDEIIRTHRERAPILINGKKWSISYRYAFPSEPVWHAALSAKG